ncbi:MAG: helix-turn-helix domain-containing protein [Oscillospiraceae bacterium]|nr:helix-turn-helix domain-containing protein [Oscillospiraceae bacterium]
MPIYTCIMVVQNLIVGSESYTHSNWVYRDVNVGFSRLYYILDGEAYYEENGKRVRLKKNHLYLTPVRHPFTLTENPDDKLLHTFAHITTVPAVQHFVEMEVKSGTPLADGVALWRKYIYSGNLELMAYTVQFVLSCMDRELFKEASVPEKIRNYIDHYEGFDFNMVQLSRELGYSREYMTRSFYGAYRITPRQYFDQRKMDIALQKLRDGESVGETAEYLNYSSPYAFSKAFKRHFGLSPTKYILTLGESHGGF